MYYIPIGNVSRPQERNRRASCATGGRAPGALCSHQGVQPQGLTAHCRGSSCRCRYAPADQCSQWHRVRAQTDSSLARLIIQITVVKQIAVSDLCCVRDRVMNGLGVSWLQDWQTSCRRGPASCQAGCAASCQWRSPFWAVQLWCSWMSLPLAWTHTPAGQICGSQALLRVLVRLLFQVHAANCHLAFTQPLLTPSFIDVTG
jgi:hypothetical protein